MPREKFSVSGFTVLEVLAVVGIMLVIAAGTMPLWSTFSSRQDVETSVYKLYQDFRQAWQFSRSLRDNHKYYGIRFYNNLVAQDGTTRYGYKILFFYGDAIDQDPALPITNATNHKEVKSSVAADIPELLENTFFSRGVGISASSEIVACNDTALCDNNTVIFTPLGSATTDGQDLLTADKDSISIGKGSYSKTIIIFALTGNVKIQ